MSIVPRDFEEDFADVPKHWLAGHAAATQISNGVNLLFPHGERFFVRSVKYFMDQIEDPALLAQIKGFFGQEGRHARAHDRFNEILRGQGYEIDQFLERYEAISSWIEAHSPPKLRLAVTAASEHFTAILAEGAFRFDLLDAAHPAMRDLLAWHAAEEIEHKAVAFDVLKQVDPSYALRVAGLLLATTMLGGFWAWAALVLLKQDGLSPRATRAAMKTLPNRNPIIRRVFLRGIREYLRRDFHPSQIPNDSLATSWMAARGMHMPEAA
ncbi:MAG TPA: metal-dependent hydrolase [Kofleriaceae bacterium]|jgi:hypothetical protein